MRRDARSLSSAMEAAIFSNRRQLQEANGPLSILELRGKMSFDLILSRIFAGIER